MPLRVRCKTRSMNATACWIATSAPIYRLVSGTERAACLGNFLLQTYLRNTLVSVSQCVHGNASGEVKKFPPITVPEPASFPVV